MPLERGRRINLNLPAKRPRPGLGHCRYVVRQADGEVVLRTTDAVYARRFLAELSGSVRKFCHAARVVVRLGVSSRSRRLSRSSRVNFHSNGWATRS